jgi:hypothetical protein
MYSCGYCTLFGPELSWAFLSTIMAFIRFVTGGEVHKNKVPFLVVLFVSAIVYSSKQVKGAVSALLWQLA